MRKLETAFFILMTTCGAVAMVAATYAFVKLMLFGFGY